MQFREHGFALSNGNYPWVTAVLTLRDSRLIDPEIYKGGFQ